MKRLALALSLCFVGSCVERVSVEAQGEAVFRDPQFATSQFNDYACSTCHRSTPSDRPELLLPGGTLAGVTLRPTFWGGAFRSIDDAVDQCFRKFMRGGSFERTRDESILLYAYLQSLETAPGAITAEVPFTVPVATSIVPGGDATRGAQIYVNACAYCHGAPRGSERPVRTASVIPVDTENEHTTAMGYTQETLRAVFFEKSRHGAYLGFAGVMPPFSTEVLTDAQLADVVEYINPQVH